MRTDKISNAMLALMFSLIVLLSGCLSPVADAKTAPVEMFIDFTETSHDEKLFFDYNSARQNMAEGNVWRSMCSFTGIEQPVCSDRVENRTYFTSILAVLFKIVIIPSIVMRIMRVADVGSFDVLGRMMRFVHDSDGKKNN